MKPSLAYLAKRSVRRIEVKDWVSIGFSASALLVSLLTVYFTQIRKVDDLRVAFTTMFNARADESILSTIIESPLEIAFVNNGNRTIAVSGVGIGAVENSDADDCKTGSGQFVPYELEPFVINAGQVLVKKAVIPENPSTHQRKYVMSFMNSAKPEARKFTFCFVVSLITPDRYLEEKKIPVWKLTTEIGNAASRLYLAHPIRPSNETIVLLP
jgi:hypothetical protein